jgi:ferredoxin/flavodoxin
MIFYFTATGNCKHVATRIAEVTGDKTGYIADFMKNEQNAYRVQTGERIGLVSPTYGWGLPSIVEDFLKTLSIEISDDNYFFYVATYGTTPGATGRLANDILKTKGLSFDGFFSVKMPDTWTPMFDLSDAQKVSEMNAAADAEIDIVSQLVKECTTGDYMNDKLPYVIVKPFHAVEYEVNRRTKHLYAEENCLACGKCAKNCPVQAIVIRDGKPQWIKEQCVMCLRCLHNCPVFAIQYGKNTKKHGQYIHP